MVPKAMVGTVVINTVAGLIFLIPVCFVLPDLTMLANLASGQPTPVIFKHALGSSAGAFCLMIPLLVLGVICGVGCVTATSRCTWAFARDGGIPGSGWWSTVDKKLGIPLNAMMLGMLVEIGLGAIYFGSTAAYNAFSGVGVIFLTMSYACPVAVSLFFRRREDIKNASFNFGIVGAIANVIALGMSLLSTVRLFLLTQSTAWSCLAIPLFCMPTLKTVTLESMNYASVVFVGFVFIAAAWYIVWGYQNYRGPPTDAVERDSDSSSLPEATTELPTKTSAEIDRKTSSEPDSK